jgi:hypothetical protein
VGVGVNEFLNPAFYVKHYPDAWDVTIPHQTDRKKTVTTDLDKAIDLAAARADSAKAFLSQSPTTTPAYRNTLASGAVPNLHPFPGVLRALLQPVIYFTLTQGVDDFEPGETVALQFWGEGRVMMTPLPVAAAKGRVPTTNPANKLFGYVAVPRGEKPGPNPNPGMLRSLLQPIIFFTLTEPVDAFEAGDTVGLQFWGDGRVMLTPFPAEAARGRIPTTHPANKLHGYVAVPQH